MRIYAGRNLCLAFLLGAVAGGQAVAQAPSPDRPTATAPAVSAETEAQIRATLSLWYEELLKKDKGRPHFAVAPGFIEASRHYDYVDTGSRARAPRIFTSLAARALKFAWEIDVIRADARFARVEVWERGYFYAWAAQKTYENAAATSFMLERQDKDGRWLIVAHQSGSYGIPPNKVTDPMPDLREMYEMQVARDAARKVWTPE